MSERIEKVKQELIKYAATFIETASTNQSLITVTSCDLSPDLKKATIFITVFPESKEKPALDFLKRQRSELREHLKKNFHMKVIPFVEIELDAGEKHRQHMDDLFREAGKM